MIIADIDLDFVSVNSKQLLNKVEQDIRNYILSHDGLNPAHVPYWRVNNPTLDEFCFTMIGRADIEGSQSNVAMNAFKKYFKLRLNACFVSKKTQAASNGTAWIRLRKNILKTIVRLQGQSIYDEMSHNQWRIQGKSK